MVHNENDFSFERGWFQVSQSNQTAVKRKLMIELQISTRQQFWNYLRGRAEPRFTEKAAIEQVFAEYGITKVWGKVQGIIQLEDAAAYVSPIIMYSHEF